MLFRSIVVREEDGNRREYILTKFSRSNQSNCYNQRPIVFKGQKVEKGEYEENDSLRLNGKENKGMGDLALHLKTLEIFFGLYLPEISDYEKAYLNKALRELYAKYGITLTMRLKDKKIDKFPIIKDLYDYLREKSDRKSVV